jgi:NAD(P)-dependent dehydrogenase (short-subunit alcohol dehydrogenase family)
MLGEAGATVYCTGRSSRVQPNLSSHINAGRPETIEETADMVTADGGRGIPVRVDHTAEDEVVGLFERVSREQSRLDVLAIVMMETLLKRLVLGLANDLGKAGVTAVAVAPGFLRTEAILEGFGVTEQNWRDALGNPQAAAMGWGGSETPCFVGRAVAALATDSRVARKNGGIYTTRVLSQEYGFNDVDGTRPDYAVLDAAIEQAKDTFLAQVVDASRFTEVDWKLAAKAEMPS